MIVRIQVLVTLCSVVGYITTINGLYLNYGAPKGRALENRNEDLSPRTSDEWYRKGRYHKKLVILDRKDKRVDAFVKKLMSLIEMNDGDKLMNEEIHNINCRHVSFGSIYNSRPKRKRCKKNSVYKRKRSWIDFVIPFTLKKNFVDSTRERFADEYLQDINRRDIDFDYFNTVNRAFDNKTELKPTEVIAEDNGENSVEPESLRRHHTRFKIIPNKDSLEYKGKRTKEKKHMPSDNSNTDNTDDSEASDDEKENKTKNSDNDVDANDSDISKNKRPEMKKIKDEWNDIMNTPETELDSSEASSPPKKGNKQGKNTYGSNSSENQDGDSGASSEEFKPHKNDYKDDSDNEKYVYIQGHRLYDVKANRDSRRMRMKNYFLPKRSFWNEHSIKHLGAYWNSHEVAGINTK